MVANASYKSNSHWGWNKSPTRDGWWFIGNTSSDEMTGHFYGLNAFLDASVRGAFSDADAARGRRLQVDMLDRIVRNGLVFIDVDGKHRTRWGVWDPSDMNGNWSWSDERGLNSLQVLSFLLSTLKHRPGGSGGGGGGGGGGDDGGDAPAYALFEETARELILGDARYDLNILNQKITNPAEINFSDNDLAFKPYYTLSSACGFGRWFRRKEEQQKANTTLSELCEALAPAFHASLERAYGLIASEKQALFAAIYAVASEEGGGRDEAIATALSTLAEYPRDLIQWPTDNSDRLDLIEDKAVLPVLLRSMEAIPRHESCALRWCDDPFQFVCGSAMREEDPTFFLEVYWMCRAHGLLLSAPL